MRSSNLLEHVFECLKKYKWVWLVPTVAFMAIAGGYNKLIATKTYSARQSLILRDDLLGDAFKPSRFESQESLKSAQETILEIARKPHVIRAVLEKLGPASSWSFATGNYPSDDLIESTQGDITLNAPNGGEFGKTEAVVLSVKTTDAERSRKFMNLLLDEVDSKLGEVRMLRLESMQNELSRASANSMAALTASSMKLRDLEKSFGSDITTIRGLNDPQGSGGFDLKLNQIRLEQREAAAQLASAKNQRRLLVEAERSGGVEFVTSNELLELQPALGGIMTNLATAMAQLAINEGRYTELHPELKRSRRAVERQKQQLFDSIGTTIKGLDSQIETLGGLDESLKQSIAEMQQQLENLTEQRVPYATLEEEVKKKSEVYNEVQGRLAQVKSHAMSSGDVTMLTRVDQPQVSSRPDQIGATQAGLLGGALGLIFGLGLVALLSPPFVDPRTAHLPDGFQGSVASGPASPQPHRAAATASDRPEPAFAAATMASTDTAAETRLKSVTAMQRSVIERSAQSREQAPLGGDPIVGESSTAATPTAATPTAAAAATAATAESTIPDSIAQHMAAIKRSAAQGIAPKRREDPIAQPPQRESTPPVAMPKLESDQNQGSAETAATESAPAPSGADAASAKKRPVSSADVVAAFKKLRTSSPPATTKEIPGDTQAAKPSSAATAPSSSTPPAVPTSRSAAPSSLASQLPQPTGSVTRDEVPLRELAQTVENSEIVIVERARSPRVPESITNGRITAESLLKSAEKNSATGDGAAASKTPAASNANATDSQRLSALAQDPPAVASPQGAIRPPGEAAPEKSQSASRIPSITDYARSLDDQVESGQSDRQLLGDDDVSTKRKSNVRPLDIARASQEPVASPSSASDLSPSESLPNTNPSTNKGRPKTMSELVGAMENSVAGLMREAKNSSMVFDSSTPPTPVSPSEQASAAKPKTEVTPQPRTEVSSTAIPLQIKNLSNSFSSFARPSDPEPRS